MAGNTTLNGGLILTNGILDMGNYNLTVGGTVAGGSLTSFVNQSGTGRFIKRGSSVDELASIFPIGMGTSYVPVNLYSLSGTVAANSTITVATANSQVVPGIPGTNPLNRQWTTSSTGITGSVLANFSFAYDNNDRTGGATAYDLFVNNIGSWIVPSGLSQTGVNPMASVSSPFIDATWSGAVSGKRVFYSLKSGSWDDATVWTLDPSGSQPNNPNGITPATSPTSIYDEVVILSGRTITVSSGAKVNAKLTVYGVLDLTNVAGHSFTDIAGSGKIRIAGNNFPAGNATDFISAGQGEGIVEFYGASRDITLATTYYNVEVNMGTNTLTLLNTLTLNGSLLVKSGTLSINNTTANTNLKIIVRKDITVNAAGNIVTGSANACHQIDLYGNLKNYGHLAFTNRTVPIVNTYYTTHATNGTVHLNCLNAVADQSIFCDGPSNFYRIKINKGTDDTYILNIDATSTANFNLFGYTNYGNPDISQLAADTNALALLKGTVRIGDGVTIPSLAYSGNYNICAAAQLWVDGGSVYNNTSNAIVPYGKLRITSGLLESRVPSGITLRESGLILVDGGVINTRQIRTSVLGAAHLGGYIQTGGEVNVIGGAVQTNYYTFCLTYPNSIFNMSGGTLRILPSNSTLGALLINSDPENIKVTGGTVIFEAVTAYPDFKFNSRAPFWNLELRNTSTAQRDFIIDESVDVGTTLVDLAAQPLKVLNDFRIVGAETGGTGYPVIRFTPVTSTTNVNDLYIGGSFYLENGAQYIPILGGTTPYNSVANQPTTTNTTYFNQTEGTSANEELYFGNATAELEFGKLVVNKTTGNAIRLAAPATRTNGSVLLDVNGDISVLSGTLDQGNYTIRTWGNIFNYDRMGTNTPTTPSTAQVQFADKTGLTINTSNSAVFGNVQFNVSPPTIVSLTSDIYIERLQFVKGLIYLKNFNLKVDDLWNLETNLFENVANNSNLKVVNSGLAATCNSMIFTDGNAGDGGLTLRIYEETLAENQVNRLNNRAPVTFPVGFTPDGGTNLYFRPAQMVVADLAAGDDGYVTVRPVRGALPTSNLTGGEVLQHYWRVSRSGFNTNPTVAYRFYYRNNAGVANVDLLNNETNFLPGKVLDESPYTRAFELLADIDIVGNFGDGNNSRMITFNGTSTNGLFTNIAVGFEAENTNFTAGVSTRFSGSVRIYYTRDHGINDNDGTQHIGNREPRWNNNETWTRSDILNPLYSSHDSRQPAVAVGDYPRAGDVAQIGWIPYDDIQKDGDPANGGTATDNIDQRGLPHGVWIDDNTQAAAEVVFYKMTDISGNPVARKYRSNFQFRPTLCINNTNGQLTAKNVRGEGMFWNRDNSDPSYYLMDIGDFAREDSSYVLYENFETPFTYQNTAPLFPNVMISNDGWGNNNHDITFARDINTTGDFEILGDINLVLSSGATGNINIGRTLKFFESTGAQGGRSYGGAEIAYQNTGNVRTITVGRGISMKNTSAIINVRNPNGGLALDHALKVNGDIYIDEKPFADETPAVPNGLQLGDAGSLAHINLYMLGSENATYTIANPTVGNVTNLYRLIIDKGSSIASTIQFDCNFNLNGPTLGAGIAKALELKNGLFIMNNAATNINLTTGNDYFSIPSTSGLELRLGTANAIGGSGIELDGLLRIAGGTMNMAGGNNPIEYSSSGNSVLQISSGSLTVGAQIRRSPTSNIGTLDYTQSGGTVIVGENSATVNNRGVFEILNPGSAFNMSGGDLYICRQQSNPTIASFYFDPDVNNISTAANIHIGHSSLTPVNQTISIYAGGELPKLHVYGYNSPTARLDIVPAYITHLLQVDAGATFNANGKDMFLSGDMSVAGTFVPNGNTVYFEGSSTQTITGNGTGVNFYNLTKTSSNNLALTATNTSLTILNNLAIQAGTLTDNSNTITVKGDCDNDGIHVYGGAGNGIVMNGVQPQILTGNGTFGKLTINNSHGVDVPVANQFKITNALRMQAGIFNIGKNLLDLGLNCTIEQASPFSDINMIETNISFTDNGVRKALSATASPVSFIYPVGCDGKYTPVILNITANGNSTGSITVKPANEIHPSIIEDTETGVAIVDADNALQYYWTMKASGISAFSGTAKMKFLPSDAKFTSPYSINDYIPASLQNDGVGNWVKGNWSDVDKVNNELNFPFSNVGDAELSSDFTAGAVDASKNGAIPDNVMNYETFSSGNWQTATVWTPNVTNGPSGAITKINAGHTITISVNGIKEYATNIYGRLNLGVTTGHRHGIIGGTGTMYLEQGSISAGVYDEFFSTAGGTIEFGGVDSYDFLGNILSVNHLTLSGSGDKRFPNNNLEILGDFTINGTALLNAVTYDNRKIYLHKDLTRTSGNFDAGANSYMVFNGSIPQNITGSFTGINAFRGLEINNINGLTLNSNVEINGTLKLTAGLINTGVNNIRINYLGIVTPAKGLSNSFVNGTLTKVMINGGSFTFPIGNNNGNLGAMALLAVNGPSGYRDWSTSYTYDNAHTAGYDTSSRLSPVIKVSGNEYWRVYAPSTACSGKVRLYLDGSSDIAGAISNINNLRIVGWNSGSNRWEVVGAGSTITGSATSGYITTKNAVNFGTYSVFTLASVANISNCTATITSSDAIVCQNTTSNVVVALSGTGPWILSYKLNGGATIDENVSSSPYIIPVPTTTANTYTYVLQSLTQGGLPGTLVGNIDAVIKVNALPNATISASATAVCESAPITFTANAGMANYNFRINGFSAQNGSSSSFNTNALVTNPSSVDVVVTNNNCSRPSSALSITVNPLPDDAGAITGRTAVCTNTLNEPYSVAAIADATSYNWTYSGSGVTINNSTTASPTINFSASATSGTLTVRGVNACGNGITSSQSIVVSNTPAPATTGSVSGSASVCRGGNYTFTVASTTNATGYLWTFSGTGVTVHGTATPVTSYLTSAAPGVDGTISIDFSAAASTGTYTLTVRATNGCSTPAAASNYNVTVNAAPTVTIPATYSGCSGTNIALLATVTGGTSPYTHQWTEAAAYSGTFSAATAAATNYNNNTGGTYTLNYLVTDNNTCQASGSTTVTISQAPVAEAGVNVVSCSGNVSISMAGATASGNYSAITWSGAGGTWTQHISNPALAIFQPSATSGTSTVTLTLTGAGGCVVNATDTRTLTWSTTPAIPSTVSQSFCSGATVADLTGTVDVGCTIDWYSSATGGTPLAVGTALTTGTYYAEARNTTTNCNSSGRTLTSVTVNNAPVITMGGALSVCGTNDLNVTGVSITNYSTLNWSVVSGGGAIISGGNTNAPVYKAASNAAASVSLQLQITALPGCVNPANQTKAVSVYVTPATNAMTHD